MIDSNTPNGIQIVPVEQDSETVSSISFMEVIRRCLSNWYWFLISVILSLCLAVFYILKTQPTYNRNATVLIKEAATRRMTTSDLESMLSNSSGQVSSKVVNEVIAFQSPALMLEVVKRLGLSTSYAVPGFFRNSVVYGAQVPVNVDFLDFPSNYAASFLLTPVSGGCVMSDLVYSFKGEKVKDGSRYDFAFRDTVSTPVGKIVIVPNEIYDAEWEKQLMVSKTSDLGAAASFLSGFDATSLDVKNRSDVLQLSLSDKSAQRADDIINMMITVYNENWVSDKNKMAVSTSSFINERLAALEKELGDVDESISSYMSTNLIPDVSTVSSMYIDQSRYNARSLQELESELYVYRYIKSYLNDNKDSSQLIPMAGSVSNSGVSAQISEYNKMLLNRNSLLSNSSDKNPIVKDLETALASTREAIETSIENQIGTLESQMALLRAQENRTNSRIAASPTQAKYLTTVGRQQKVKESLYLYLLQKREENELSQAFTAYNTRVITPPMGPAVPGTPKKKMILLAAFLFGLFLPFVVIYIVVVADNKIRGKKDIENLSLPFLGEIPQYVQESNYLLNFFRKSSDASELLVKDGKRDVINEAFRVFRTNIEFISRGSDSPVMIMTSYNPGSGKTFLTMNTAMALAIKGKKVLAIDGDMRHASLSEYIQSPKIGLSNYLNGQFDDFRKVMVAHPDNANLCVIPVGTIPPNPSELVASDRFVALLASAKKEFDYILIDCPPLDIVADTQIIEEYSDRTIFVARAGVMEKSMIANLERLWVEKKFKNLSLVLNGTESAGSYYGHYGYHSYSYYHSQS